MNWADRDWLIDLPGDVQFAWLRLLLRSREHGRGGTVAPVNPSEAGPAWRTTPGVVARMLAAAFAAGELEDQGPEWLIPNYWIDYVVPPKISHTGSHGWRRLRFQVLERDGWTCRYCGRPATHCDHVHPRSRGGTDAPENLVAACGWCNRSKNDQTVEEWQA